MVHKPQVCSGCIKYAAEKLGYDDTAPLRAEAEELRRQVVDLHEKFEQAERGRLEAEDAHLKAKIEARITLEAAARAAADKTADKPSQPKRPRSKES